MPTSIYVCVISEFTLPTLEACLSLRPEHIVLIASDGETFAQQARHLQGLLHERLEGSRVEILSHASTGEHLGGDHITANQAWLAAHLVPRLQEVAHQGGICAANLTGGTKAMALALAACHDWQRLDYQPLGNKPMQSVRASHQPHYQAQPSTERHLHDAQPLDIALLHNDKARISKPNPVREHPLALALAQSLWDAQQAQQPALQALFSGFERIWAHERGQHQQTHITQTWTQFLANSSHALNHLDDIRTWVTQLGQLHIPALLYADAQGITLPGNASSKADKQRQYLRDWISGDWLEQLVRHWLVQQGIPTSAMECNIICAGEDASGSQREADLLVHHRHVTSLIEIKAGLPPHKATAELETQLSSLGSRFGKTRKALFLGPQALRAMRAQRRSEDFWLRCRANQVTLLLMPEQLYRFVQGENKIWPDLKRGQVPPEFAR